MVDIYLLKWKSRHSSRGWKKKNRMRRANKAAAYLKYKGKREKDQVFSMLRACVLDRKHDDQDPLTGGGPTRKQYQYGEEKRGLHGGKKRDRGRRRENSTKILILRERVLCAAAWGPGPAEATQRWAGRAWRGPFNNQTKRIAKYPRFNFDFPALQCTGAQGSLITAQRR